MKYKNIPSLALALVLQAVPVCRVATTSPAVATPAFAIIARCAAAIAALLGSVDALSGASTPAYVAGVQSLLPALPGVKTNITGKVGSPMVLRIVVGGTVGAQPQLDYFNASPLPPGLTINTNVNTNSVGGASTNYYIYGTPTTAGVWYPVRLLAGNLLYPTPSTTNILITITNASGPAPPNITTQPHSQSVASGSDVTFTVVATGATSYQWNFNGTAIPGATAASYTITGATTANAGNYTVVAGNTSGSVTSTVATLTIVVPPGITSQPQNLTVTSGNPSTFQVTATGVPAPTYQWRFNGAPIASATSATLTIAATTPNDAGGYTVVVANSSGSVTSSVAILTILVPPGITSQPQSLTVTNGNPASFQVTATGVPDPTYQWRFNGAPIASATSATFTIAATTPNDAGGYTVVVANSSGSVTSSVATLTILVPPGITSQPQSLTVTNGNPATFQVTAAGTPDPTYQWRLNGASISGATAAIFTIAATSTNDAGSYTVVVANSSGSVTSSVATLTVFVPVVVPLAITSQPQSVTVTNGNSASFEVVATGVPDPTYQWRFNGAPIAGATTATYTIATTSTNDAGGYSVVVTDDSGSLTSLVATLTVLVPPTITSQPQGLTVNSGDAATFAVVATGLPAPTYQWSFNEAAITDATNASFTVPAVTIGNAGNYMVVVANSSGSVTSSVAALTVVVPPGISSAPQSLTVTNGNPATFQVTATGTPEPAYQWTFNGAPISGATAASYNIAAASTNDAGAYSVVVANSGGSVTSTVATLTVLVPPTITSQPQSLAVTSGDTATFQVVATGLPAPNYQWSFNGVAIAGATSPSLVISDAQAGAEGDYVVEVSNSAGTILSSAAHLTVGSSGPLVLSNVQFVSGAAEFDVNGPTGKPIVIWASSDLMGWTSIHTNETPSAQWHFNDTTAPATGNRFYRAQR